MGWESKEIGEAGEGLFKRLARHWDSWFVLTSSASGTDGYLQWRDLPGVRLWVQVKTIQEHDESSHHVRIYIKPGTLAEWYTYRPLLVVCELRANRGWWLDTAAERWPVGTTHGRSFCVRVDQPIHTATKTAIRRIALGRPRYLPPYIVRSMLPGRTTFLSEDSHSRLATFSCERFEELLRNTYLEMQSVGIHERDVMALAVARAVHMRLRAFAATPIDSFLELVTNRLMSPLWGGRSFTLGALTALLQPGLSNPLDNSFVPALMKAAESAVKSRTFLNPEFGLLIAASLSERYRQRRDLPEFVEYLSRIVEKHPQNLTVEYVAARLLGWLNNRDVPLEVTFSTDWLEHQVARPLAQDAGVFLQREEAEVAVGRILEKGLEAVTAQDLGLADQLIRVKASELLDEWFSSMRKG